MAPAGDHVLELRREAVAALGGVDVRLDRADSPPALGQPFRIQCLAFHPKGRWLAVGQSRAVGFALGHVALIDPEGKEKPRAAVLPLVGLPRLGAERRQEGVSSLAFSPDGRWLVAGTSSGALHCWDLSRPPARVPEWPTRDASSGWPSARTARCSPGAGQYA